MSPEQKSKISNALKGHSVSEETRGKLRKARKHRQISLETRQKLSKSLKKLPDVQAICQNCGQQFAARRKTRKYCTRECQRYFVKWKTTPNVQCDACGKPYFVSPYRLTRSDRFYCSLDCMSDGYKSENFNPRDTYTAKQWRDEVKERDGYRCAVCGHNTKIIAHHILPYQYFPELLCDLGNGITLCSKHHRQAYKRVEKIIIGMIHPRAEELRQAITQGIPA